MTWRTLIALAVLMLPLTGCGDAPGPPARLAAPAPSTTGATVPVPSTTAAETDLAADPGPATGPPVRWRTAMWGDSIAADAVWALGAAFTEASGRRPSLAVVDRSTIGDHVAGIERFRRAAAAEPPEVAVVALGTGDARDQRPAATVRSEITRVRAALRDVPCLLWVDVKAVGVNGIYPGVVAYAGWVNVVLRSELDGRPGIERLDMTRWAARHPDAFLADGLHFNANGAVRYARWLAERAQRCVEGQR